MIASLTACVFICGAIAYFHWFCAGLKNSRPWSALTPRGADDVLAVPASAGSLPALGWQGFLLAFLAGTFAAGFFFVVNLSGYLTPARRPVTPDIASGYTYFFTAKYGGVYGTYFEYLTLTYGIWIAWFGLILNALIATKLGMKLEHASSTYPLLFFVGSATSMALYYLLWQACLNLALS